MFVKICLDNDIDMHNLLGDTGPQIMRKLSWLCVAALARLNDDNVSLALPVDRPLFNNDVV